MSLLTDETESVEEAPGHFRGRISGNWSVNGNPNGGYLTAIMVDVALRKSEKKSTPIVTANFISRGKPGPAEIVVEEIAHSPQFQRFQMRLFQEGEEEVRTLATFSAEKESCSEERYETGPAPRGIDAFRFPTFRHKPSSARSPKSGRDGIHTRMVRKRVLRHEHRFR